ncbi:MAE_28990/MAE_18760 family HEPN-like nuclease [Streptomyces sp. M7]|uniref:MAE_28990/MAE_18760 family HEPN-like nuclease n=1 Tax=Streptomyces sp. M7 TaxID=255705 RepID=UPI0011C07EEE|nr:MAE_28990/MAE_18760 family HEPN-like nuclease [Streptomyces sp. M7]
MNPSEMRAQLEEDMAWRLDEIRHLVNHLLGGVAPEEASVYSLRAILVMQYAHLEGFTRNALSLYVSAVNARSLPVKELKPELMAAALAAEFDGLGKVPNASNEEEGRLTNRARRQIAFVRKLQELIDGPVSIASEVAVSMEMNLGSDVLKRALVSLGIPVEKVEGDQYSSIEFVKRVRNDIAHGSRKENISGGMFNAHLKKCEQFMNGLSRVLTQALSEEWFRLAS